MVSFTNDVDLVSRLSGYGDLSAALRNVMMGMNHRNFGSPVPFNAENHGFTFFTRPRLNLSYDNVMADRKLQGLLTDSTESMQRAIRVMLDPENATGRITTTGQLEAITSKLFDHKHAFIPLLSNMLLTASGWPDPVMQYFEAAPGPMKETFTLADDIVDINYSWEMTANFRNIMGDPITLMFLVWLRYIQNVRMGTMTPWPEEIIENRIDYDIAIWRFTLDPGRRFIQKWARTIAKPQSVPFGAALDHSTDGPLNLNNASQISVPFKCIGAEYQDPILLTEFNLLVQSFNTDMHSINRRQVMVQVPYDELAYFNFYGYPWIDVRTGEFKWYVPKDDYEALRKELSEAGHKQTSTETGETTSTTYSGHNRTPKTAEDF